MAKDLNRYISKKHIKAVEKFNEDLETFRKQTEEKAARLYENAFISFTLENVRVENGQLIYVYDGNTEKEVMLETDEETNKIFEKEYDGIMEYIKFWRACLRRAKRYWSMDTGKLDRIQDGEIEDIEEEEDD